MKITTSSASFEPRPFQPVPLVNLRFRRAPDDGGFCPELTLVCDSISASASKCGFPEFAGYESTPPKTYRTRVTTVSRSMTVALSVEDYGECASTDNFATQYTTTESYDEDCNFTNNCVSDSSMHSQTNPLGPPECIPDCSSSGWNACDYPTIDPGPPGGCAFGLGYAYQQGSQSSQTITATTSVTNYTFHASLGPHSTSDSTTTVSITLSDEYPTSELISDAESALPAYSGYYGCDYPEEFEPLDGQGCDCSAYRSLSEDETSYSIERFKYKFTFDTATVSFTISWNEHFEPDGGGSPTDTPRSEVQNIGDTESSVFTVNEPATNGTTTITDITCTVP